ncbi:MAG: class I SAM-dependent methyltransferase, partial [Candidatus Hydrogenedentota bacterium]
MNPLEALPDFGGALSQSYQGEEATVQLIYQDGAAPTGMVRVPMGDVSRLHVLDFFLQGAPYVIKHDAERALVIGVGGGLDVLISLFYGTKHVIGVEINPVMVDVVKRRYAASAGWIFDRPDVELLAAEGRHYLTTTDERFDVIQLSGVDTYSALSVGAYVLAENYLYTTEAIQSYWEHLSHNGILSFSRWLFTPPRETLRLVTIELEALRQMGIEEPERHLMVIAGKATYGQYWAETLLKRNPFNEAEVAAYSRWADRLQFEVLYNPFLRQDNAFDRIIRASDMEREILVERYPYDISPISDDNPFFFQFYRWGSLLRPMETQGGYFITAIPLGLFVLLVSLLQIFVLAVTFIIGPLVPRGTQLRQIRHKGRVLIYFGALGLGFIMVEIALMQKYAVFVGGPIYSMAVTLFAIL